MNSDQALLTEARGFPHNDRRFSRFVYFSHSTLQVPRVARQCIVALCEGVARLGTESEIVSLLEKVNSAEPTHPPFDKLYQLDRPVRNTAFRIRWASGRERGVCYEYIRLARYTIYALRLAGEANGERSFPWVVSGRNYSVLAMLAIVKKLFGAPWVVLADVHGPCGTTFQRWVHRVVDGNVCITAGLADHLRGQCALGPERVRVAHSGVKLERFRSHLSKSDAATLVGLSRERPIVCYSGKVYYPYQEVSYLIEVAQLLANEITMVIVGGRPDQITLWNAECTRIGVTNVVFTGFQPPSRIPTYLLAADLLVLYYSPNLLNDYRSPGKLFEYLASGTPIVAGHFRGVDEIVQDGVNAFLVEPYKPAVLAQRIRRALDDRSLWSAVSRQAISTAQYYTWEVRAAAFLDYAQEILELQEGD